MDNTDLHFSVIVPVYRDEEGLRQLLPELTRQCQVVDRPYEIIIVDDGNDVPLNPTEFGQAPLKLLRSPSNRGYGAALKTGIRSSRSERVVLMDADSQHNPEDLPAFLSAIETADAVIGQRTAALQSPLWRRPGRWLIRLLFNVLVHRSLSDVNCGYRCLRRSAALQILPLCSDRFSFSMSSTLLLLAGGYQTQFIPIRVRPRVGKSTITPRVGFETLMLLTRMVAMTHPLRLFLPAAVVFFLGGLGWGAPYLIAGRGLSVGALGLMLMGVLLFFIGLIADMLAMALRGIYR